MATSLSTAEQKIAETLQAGHTLTVRWDCGGDESWVYTELDGQELETVYENENNLAYLLDRYLTELLELPDAGDFHMQGTGRIFQEGPAVVIAYQSEFSDADDELLTDEELREMGLDPDEWRAEAATQPDDKPSATDLEEAGAYYSGQRVLFTLS